MSLLNSSPLYSCPSTPLLEFRSSLIKSSQVKSSQIALIKAIHCHPHSQLEENLLYYVLYSFYSPTLLLSYSPTLPLPHSATPLLACSLNSCKGRLYTIVFSRDLRCAKYTCCSHMGQTLARNLYLFQKSQIEKAEKKEKKGHMTSPQKMLHVNEEEGKGKEKGKGRRETEMRGGKTPFADSSCSCSCSCSCSYCCCCFCCCCYFPRNPSMLREQGYLKTVLETRKVELGRFPILTRPCPGLGGDACRNEN